MFITIPYRTSKAINFVAVNPVTKKAIVRYNSGAEYLFRGVSRRKILNLMLNPNLSLGFWNKSLRKNAIKYNPRLKTRKMPYEFITCTPCTNAIPLSLSN